MARLPALFIGSSTEARHIAELLQLELHRDADATVWHQGLFTPGKGFLEALCSRAADFDFALIVLNADDLTTSRGESHLSARDNVLFELGLFIGTIGRERTYFLIDSGNRPRIPSDLAGVSALEYRPRPDGNMQAALGPACTQLRLAFSALGTRGQAALGALSEAAKNVSETDATVRRTVALLARSRVSEVAVFLQSLGPQLDRKLRAEFERDLEALKQLTSSELLATAPPS